MLEEIASLEEQAAELKAALKVVLNLRGGLNL
ncbi:MAG: hypothetical protein BWX85_00906 [Chloroflexi bacterium ADurb.Bin120]|nr:MAG: hypothetical protein BWX85_00906 [Chloroflexi bacterium ADurb.Bin120]